MCCIILIHSVSDHRASYQDHNESAYITRDSVGKSSVTIFNDNTPVWLPGATDAATQEYGLYTKSRTDRVLGVCPVVAIMYLTACVGPAESEDMFLAAGPGLAIIGVLLYVSFCTIPYAMIVAELCTSFPEDAGYVVWILNGYGPFWASQIAYWALFSRIFCLAFIPGEILDMATEFLEVTITSKFVSFLIKATIATFLVIPSLLGTKNLGRICMVLFACSVIPSSIYCIWALTDVDGDHGSQFFEIRRANNASDTVRHVTGPADVQWVDYINAVFWNFDGLLSPSMFAGHVMNPGYVYPRALMYNIVATFATYMLCFIATILNRNIASWSLLEDGGYIASAASIGGSSLHTLIFLSVFVSNCAFYMSQFFCGAYEISGMAQYQLIPAMFSKRSHFFFDSSFIAIFVHYVSVLIVLAIDLDNLLPMTNALSALLGIGIVITAMKLRHKMPFVTRPFKVPGDAWVIVILGIMPMLSMSYMVVTTLMDPVGAIGFVAVVVPGLLFGIYRKRQDEL